jgi:hypothetical protein
LKSFNPAERWGDNSGDPEQIKQGFQHYHELKDKAGTMFWNNRNLRSTRPGETIQYQIDGFNILGPYMTIPF